MRKFLKILTALLLLSISADALAQGRLYTRKAKLEDFPTRTTKVVTSSGSLLDLAFKEEVATRWRISPFEFCTPEEFGALNSDNSLYFLYIGHEDGISYLVLYKGGEEDEDENLKKPFEVARIPISSSSSPSGRELMLIGAAIDIMQAFVEDAMVSEQAAYSGLKWYNGRSLKGKTIYLDPDEADSAYTRGEQDALIGVCVAPHSPEEGKRCFKMLIAADTNELYYFDQARYRGPEDAAFGDSEIKKFGRRNGIVTE